MSSFHQVMEMVKQPQLMWKLYLTKEKQTCSERRLNKSKTESDRKKLPFDIQYSYFPYPWVESMQGSGPRSHWILNVFIISCNSNATQQCPLRSWCYIWVSRARQLKHLSRIYRPALYSAPFLFNSKLHCFVLLRLTLFQTLRESLLSRDATGMLKRFDAQMINVYAASIQQGKFKFPLKCVTSAFLSALYFLYQVLLRLPPHSFCLPNERVLSQ